MLEVRNLIKKYYSKKGTDCVALRNVSINFGERGMTFICGKSGSGKSTLLNLLSGLDRADHGQIIVDGKSFEKFSQSDFDTYRNTYVGFVFQDFNILDNLSVAQNISLSLELQNKKPSKEAILKALKEVGLEGCENRRPFELSGGQKQRVSIARALVKDPAIIFADEPTGNLDADTTKQILDLFKRLSKTRLVIMVSHDFDSAVEYGDRIIELSDGRVVSDKTRVAPVNLKEIKADFLQQVDAAFSPTPPINADETEKFVPAQNSMPFSHAVKTTFSNFKRKFGRFLVTTILAVVALTIFGLADTLNAYDAHAATVNTTKDLNISTYLAQNTYLSPEKIAASTDSDDDGEIRPDVVEFTPQKLALLEAEGATFFEAVTLSVTLRNYADIPTKDKIYTHNGFTFTHVVQTDDVVTATTLSNFYGSKLVAGGFPVFDVEAPEVMISDFMAAGMSTYGVYFDNFTVLPGSKPDAVVGGEFTIPFSDVHIKITGIYSTDFETIDFTARRTFQSEFNLKSVYGAMLAPKNLTQKVFSHNNASVHGYVEVEKNNTSSKTKDNSKLWEMLPFDLTSSEISLSDLNYVTGLVERHSKIIKDVDMNNLKDDEIIIPLSIYIQLNEINTSDIDGYTPETYLASLSDESVLMHLKVKQHNADRYNFHTFKVVGIFDDSIWEYSKLFLVCNKQTRENFYKFRNPIIGVFLTINGVSDPEDYLAKLQNNDVAAVTYATSELKYIEQLFYVMGNIFEIIAFAMGAFVLLLIYSFMSSSIKSRQREIGILRSLGARNIDIAKIFMLEGVIIYIIYVFATLGLLYLGTFAINWGLTVNFTSRLTIITFRGASYALSIAVCAVIMLLAMVIPLLKIMLLKPIDAIKTAAENASQA